MCVQEGVLTVQGHIDFDNVVGALKKSTDLLSPLSEITIDLQNVTQSDSSGLALLVAWMRMARMQQKKIIFLNVPAFLKDLARVSGLSGLLGEDK
jgi:phospholipid transport system transporter-binding protein